MDDQSVIHDAFRTVFARPDTGSAALDDIEASLFGETPTSAAEVFEFTLDHAMQGHEALQKVDQALAHHEHYAVAFVDMRMPPGWDGLETIEKLFAADPLLQVVMCTAYSDYTWGDVLKRLGYTDRLLLLKKPFSNEEALQLAISLTEKRRLANLAQTQLQAIESANLQLQHEVDMRYKAQEQLLIAATHDTLTQLPNRALFAESLCESCTSLPKTEHAFDAVYALDIDNFNSVNDVYGRTTGDLLLTQVAERLKRNHRSSDDAAARYVDLPARLGGDQFVLLIHDLPSVLEASTIARRLIAALKEPFLIDGDAIVVTTSVGIALIDRQSTSPDDVLRRADIAMYRAKLAGKDQFAIFDSSMHEAVLRRIDIEAALSFAIERSELRLEFQPIHDAATRELLGFEALLRWTNAKLGVVSPGEFIPVAEDSRLMISIGEWVLRQACRQVGEWRELIPAAAQLRMSVNVSRKQLGRPDFLDRVRTILADFPDVGSSLNFEVTESSVMSNPQVVAQILFKLRLLGIHIHMDDFGTGHSSLSCLHQFPIDVLKIDSSFVMNMDSNTDNAAVIHSIITLAHHHNIKVVAEGVETCAQANLLRDLGCEFLQGYYFSKPISAGSAETLIAEKYGVGTQNQSFPPTTGLELSSATPVMT